MKITDLKKETQEIIALNHFDELTKIQDATISMVRKNKDIVAIGDTGTGKTHAYLLSIAEKINPDLQEVQAVISAPTRELAYQIKAVADDLKKVYPGLRIKLLTGGQDSERMKAGLKNIPQVIIGTPGRIRAMFEDNSLRVDKTRMFIIDEADMTLEYGFLEDIDVVFSKMVHEPEILCFSATFPEGLRPFVKKYLANPQIIRIESEKLSPRIEHVLIDAKHMDYDEAFFNIVKGFDPYVCLIFGNTRDDCDKAYELLKKNGIDAVLLHAGLQSRERQKAMRALASQKYRYVVASDVAARGIDIEGISHVVSLGFPSDLSFYTHRAGRTGRSGKEGTCFTIYKKSDEKIIRTLKKQGIHFRYRSFKNGEWKDLKDPFTKAPRKSSERDIEIAKLMTKKSAKVKPNYKKRRKTAITEAMRKERRDFIREKIRQEKKARYRAAARAKKEEA